MLLLLFLPVVSLAEQQNMQYEPASAANPTPQFGESLGFDDAWREKRENEHARILRAAGARGFYVADANNLSVAYFARRENTSFVPGSTTKIMTALLTIENVSLDDVAAAPPEATRLGGTNTMLGLETGEEMRVEDLLYGLMLVSGNDCAITLAFLQSDSESAFAKLMNQRAAALGMKNSNFTNPCGRNVGDNHSTPYDLALLTQDALKNETFCEIVGAAEHTIPANAMRKKPMVIRNANRLVSDTPGKGFYYPYAIGVKTGATALGTSLVTAARKEDVTIISVQMGMLGDDNAKRRQELFTRAVEFFDYVFTYEYAEVDAASLLGAYSETVPVQGADPNDGMLTLCVDTTGATAYRSIAEIDLLASGAAEFTVETDVHATAPIAQGETVGTATFSYNGRVWFTLPLIAANDVVLTTPTPTPSPTPEPPRLKETATPLAPAAIVDEPVTVAPAPLTPAPTDSTSAALADAAQEPDSGFSAFFLVPMAAALLIGALAAALIFLKKRK